MERVFGIFMLPGCESSGSGKHHQPSGSVTRLSLRTRWPSTVT